MYIETGYFYSNLYADYSRKVSSSKRSLYDIFNFIRFHIDSPNT